MTIVKFFEKARELLSQHDGYIRDNVDFFIGDMEDLFLEWNYQETEENNESKKSKT